MRKKLLSGILLLLAASVIWAQPEAESSGIKIVERSPAAPNTASLGKYFDVPVNMSTGLPTIQIPIYTIKTGNISFPIALSYSPAGIKVNTPASWVGFGWDLNCGGVITKQVNGLDDFYALEQYAQPQNGSGHAAWSTYMNPSYTMAYDGNLGFQNMSDIIDSLRSSTFISVPGNQDGVNRILGRIIYNWYDGESDEYHYSTPEGGGSIFYNQKTASFQNNEINGWQVYFDPYNNAWSIVAKDGKGYYFTAREEALSPYFQDPVYPYPDKFFTSAWYLTGMGDQVNGRGITINYDYSSMRYFEGGTSRTENWTMNGYPASFAGGYSNIIRRYGNQLNVQSIVFAEGRIEFIKDPTARIDEGINALKTIKIYDHNNVLRKQFELTYFYGWNGATNTSRLMLQSVQEINYLNGSALESKPYVFQYELSIPMPPRFSYAQDLWGYNNGKTTNTTNIPDQPGLSSLGIPPYANRNIDPNFTQAGILKQITYPTGGNIQFLYENNRETGNLLAGGIRIKRITNTDNLTGKTLVSEYRYVDGNGESTGTVYARPSYYYFVDKGQQGIAHLRISGEPVFPLFGSQGSPVNYSLVEKVEMGDGEELKSRHYFHNDLGGINASPELTYQYIMGVPYNKVPDIKRFSNLPFKTEILKKVGTQYKRIKEDVQEYSTLGQFSRSVWNVQAAWANPLGSFTEWEGHDPYTLTPIEPSPSVNAYKLFQESVVNNASTSMLFDDNDIAITQTTNKTFDPDNGNVKTITTVKSNGNTERTYFTYAADLQYTNGSDPVNQQLNLLIDANILAAPVEIVKTVTRPGGTETLVQAELFFYENNKLKKNMVLEEDIPYSSFVPVSNDNNGFYYDSRYVADNEIESFDANKNPLQIKLRNKTQSLVWDHDYLLATAVNAPVSEIAATSFESTAKGNWTYSGSTSTDNTAPTGSKTYNLSGGTITKTQLDPNKQYIISYWSKNGQQNAGGTVTTGLSLNGWTYFEHLVTPASGNVEVSGSGVIDELRLYPKGALMSTYTYLPLTGMQTQCDANNRISYYEYDGFGRLVLIKDQDKNVLKKICYNFAGQAENCATNCTNTTADWQNTATPPVCEQGICGNTGYQLQEQRDMNPCSPTYDTLRTIQVYNPSACTPGSGITITYNNITNTGGFTATYTNSSSGQVYSFSVPASGSGTLGCIPAGTYSLSISKPGNMMLVLFGTGCFALSGNSAYFNKVIVGPPSNCNMVTLEHDY